MINGQTINLGGPGDTTPPTVSLTASPTAVTAPGNVNLTATASDDRGIGHASRSTKWTRWSTPHEDRRSVHLLDRHDLGEQRRHSYTAKAYDTISKADDLESRVTVSVNPDDLPPVVSLAAARPP